MIENMPEGECQCDERKKKWPSIDVSTRMVIRYVGYP